MRACGKGFMLLLRVDPNQLQLALTASVPLYVIAFFVLKDYFHGIGFVEIEPMI